MTSTIDQTPTDTDNDTPVTTTDTTTDTSVTTDTSAAIDPAIIKLEAAAARHIASATKAGTSLADILVKLYSVEAWKAHGQSIADYYGKTIGIGPEGFVLPKAAREQLVVAMSDANPDAPLAHMVHMSGASLSSINRARSAWELANPNRQAAQLKSASDDDTDTDDDTPATPRKTRVQTVNVIEIVDNLSDPTMLMAILTHASARLAEINKPSMSPFTTAA